MRWQASAALLVLLALVGGFYLYDLYYLEPAKETSERQKDRLWTLEAKDIDEVVVKRIKDTVRLQRAAGGWQMLEPVAAPGARGAIDTMVTTLVDARMDRRVADTPSGLQEFGLDPPAVEVTLTAKGQPSALLLGSTSPTGAWVYAKKREQPGVFLVSETLLREATKAAADFRDRVVLSFEKTDVNAIEVVTPDDTIQLERTEPRQWRITKPVTLPADAETVQAFVDKLHDAQVKEFVAERPTALGPYGLERPLRVQLTVGKDKDRTTKTLLIGRADAERKGVYAMRPGEPSVLLLADDVWTALPKNVGILRDKTVFAFDREQLTRLTLASPKGTVSMAKEGDRWRITAPEALPGDTAVIGGLLFQLADLKAQAFLPSARFTPTVTLSLWEGESPTPKVLRLGPSRERRGGEPSAYASADGVGPVLVDGRVLSDLSKSVAELRDHMFFGQLDHRAVQRVKVTSAGQSALFERTGESGWRMLEPTRGRAKGAQVEDLVVTVTALRWNEIVVPGTDLKAYGLDPPSLEIMLMRADGSELATVRVGKREGSHAHVQTSAPTVYTVDTTRLGGAPKVPDDFQE